MRYTKLLLRNASHLPSYETGRVPVNVLLQRGYRFEFKVRGTKEPGSDYGGLRRAALVLIAQELFSEENGYVRQCLSHDGEHSGILQINSCRRTIESQEGASEAFLGDVGAGLIGILWLTIFEHG